MKKSIQYIQPPKLDRVKKKKKSFETYEMKATSLQLDSGYPPST
jgi:hypothetical protein